MTTFNWRVFILAIFSSILIIIILILFWRLMLILFLMVTIVATKIRNSVHKLSRFNNHLVEWRSTLMRSRFTKGFEFCESILANVFEEFDVLVHGFGAHGEV